MLRKKVAIIGAGIAGLTTAYQLSKNNFEVEIFEKSSEVGGLLRSFKFENKNIEEYYHHIFKTDKDIINLINELGLGDKLIWEKTSISIYYNNTIYPFSGPVDLLKFKPLNFFEKIRLGVVILYLQRVKNWEKFLRITADKWLKKMCGEKVYNVVWLPLLKGKFHNHYDSVSMSWFWARIHTRANSKSKGSIKEKLGYLNGGFQILINALKNGIEKNNGKINLNCSVEKIISENENVKILLSNGNNYNFNKVICTMPSSVFAKLIKENNISDDYLKQLKSIKYLGAICAVLVSKKSLSDYYWHNINDVNSPFLVFIQHTNFINKSNYNNKYIYYIGTYLPYDHKYFNNIDNNVVYNDFFKYLKNIFSDFNEKDIIEKHLFKSKYAQHIVDCEYKNRIPNYKTPIPNVYLENFSQIFPEDRGLNFSIRESIKVSNLLQNI
ncbi:MAG: NAD(P)/FAD-dependent oxidoreductase [Candidatus Falkowbacteria bacterium]